MNRNIVLGFLIGALILCLCIAPAMAKEEVVYANLDASGDLEGLYVVNIFDVA